MSVTWNRRRVSAFADEIGDELQTQLEVLAANDVGNIELRGVWGKGVLDLSAAEVRRVNDAARQAGVGFSAVASPIGKFPVAGDFAEERERMRRALEYAALLEAPFVRIFSYFIPAGDDAAVYRNQVLDWLGALAALAQPTGVRLAHENERGIYGDTGDRVLDLLDSIDSPAFTGIFDFANFVVCGQDAYRCWQQVRPHISYFHIKDAVAATGTVVPAGDGDGALARILGEAYAAGFDSFLTLEPHLDVAAASHGRTSPARFGIAADALGRVLTSIGEPAAEGTDQR
jgi:sugar phosphate isomerase/epimerase